MVEWFLGGVCGIASRLKKGGVNCKAGQVISGRKSSQDCVNAQTFSLPINELLPKDIRTPSQSIRLVKSRHKTSVSTSSKIWMIYFCCHVWWERLHLEISTENLGFTPWCRFPINLKSWFENLFRYSGLTTRLSVSPVRQIMLRLWACNEKEGLWQMSVVAKLFAHVKISRVVKTSAKWASGRRNW